MMDFMTATMKRAESLGNLMWDRYMSGSLMPQVGTEVKATAETIATIYGVDATVVEDRLAAEVMNEFDRLRKGDK